MTLQEFRKTLTDDHPPTGLSSLLKAMWYDGKDDWEMAHNIAQDIHSKEGSLIHAYLHRKEGDDGNAGYWYARAGEKFPTTSLEKEWEFITTRFLEDH
jgi:hypothetical protein